MVIAIKETQLLEKFDGKVEEVKAETGEYGVQYIMKLVPFDKTLIKQGKTGAFWNYLRVSETSSDSEMAKDSVMEKFYTAVCRVDEDLKKAKTLPEFFNLIKGKSYTFTSEKLGKAFEGHEARKIWLPSKKL